MAVKRENGEALVMMGEFLREWSHLAETGACDGAGGAEFTRVCGEWFAAGRPPDVAGFIRCRANVGSAGE